MGMGTKMSSNWKRNCYTGMGIAILEWELLYGNGDQNPLQQSSTQAACMSSNERNTRTQNKCNHSLTINIAQYSDSNKHRVPMKTIIMKKTARIKQTCTHRIISYNSSYQRDIRHTKLALYITILLSSLTR